MYKPTVLLMVLLLIVCSCSDSTKVPDPPSGKPASPPKVQPQKAPSNVPSYKSQADPNLVAPPKGAQYTIWCAKVDGDLHVERANRIRDDLKATTNMKDWYVVHENERSQLFYGYYRTINDPKDSAEAARAQKDRQRIDLMADNLGNRPFRDAVFVELSAPDPAAPPEWNLVNAKGAYTLQIAAYKDSPQRKEAAVETVRAARTQGIEAYYYHGPVMSLVCIGSWPETAVRISDGTAAGRGTDQSQPLMVVPQTNDQEFDKKFEEIAHEGNLRLVKHEVKVVSPTLLATMRQYPYNAVNGSWIKRVVNGQDRYDESLLLPIPRTAPTAPDPVSPLASPQQPAYDPAASPASSNRPAPRQPAPAPRPGVGQLKSIGG